MQYRLRAGRFLLVLALSSFATTLAVGVFATPAAAEPGTLVFINGRASHVYFNDGDSFRVLDGPRKGQKARLGGFNTLESFGPAHSWGQWHPYELYVNAKMATLNGRRGVWHCHTDESSDTYGRLLLFCPDLIIDSLKKGLAHAYSVDDTPAPPEYIAAQQEAMKAKRGMWAHGVPDFILTSTHSNDEGYEGKTYNRLVSTRDGHTEKWLHKDIYRECDTVCATDIRVDQEKIEATARKMRQDPTLAPLLKEWFNIHLEEFASRYVRLGILPEYISEDLRKVLTPWLEKENAAGNLGSVRSERGSCMLYVQFQRRYGLDNAVCLHGHGVRPGEKVRK